MIPFRISSFGIRIFIRERPFGGVYPDKGRAQDRLGAKNFVEVVLWNILSVRIYRDDFSNSAPTYQAPG